MTTGEVRTYVPDLSQEELAIIDAALLVATRLLRTELRVDFWGLIAALRVGSVLIEGKLQPPITFEEREETKKRFYQLLYSSVKAKNA
jgi:hypothetical protein